MREKCLSSLFSSSAAKWKVRPAMAPLLSVVFVLLSFDDQASNHRVDLPLGDSSDVSRAVDTRAAMRLLAIKPLEHA